jgi:hypothetical protein
VCQEAIDVLVHERHQAFASRVAHNPADESHGKALEAERIDEREGRRELPFVGLDGIQELCHVIAERAFEDLGPNPRWTRDGIDLLPESRCSLRVLLDESEDDLPPRAGLLEVGMVEQGLKRDHRRPGLTAAVPAWPSEAIDEDNPPCPTPEDRQPRIEVPL